MKRSPRPQDALPQPAGEGPRAPTWVRLAVVPVILALPLLLPANAAAQRYDLEAYVQDAAPGYDAEAYPEPAARRYESHTWYDPAYDALAGRYDDIYEFSGEYYGYDVYSYVDAYHPAELYDFQRGFADYGMGYPDRWDDTGAGFATEYP